MPPFTVTHLMPCKEESGLAIAFNTATKEDLPFLEEMLYEAVYWRAIAQGANPPFREGLEAEGVYLALDDFGNRPGDTAIIATLNGINAGAATYRFYSKENAIRGYLDDNTPAITIAVKAEIRGQGIATELLTALLEHARENCIPKISLMVSNDNVAKGLYEKCGFTTLSDNGDSCLMIREL